MINIEGKVFKRVVSFTIIISLFFLSIFNLEFTNTIAAAKEKVTITNLEVESTTNPIGIDKENPRFSWIMESDIRGQKQSAYQIIVSTDKKKLKKSEGDIWDTGKIKSDQSNNIKYEGKALSPTTRYYWTVKVWDKDGNQVVPSNEAWFETGLMGTGWDNAKWIGAPEYELDAKSKPVFNIDYEVMIPEGSSKGSFIFGANDPRLMDKNKNNYSIAGENFIKYEIDLSKLVAGTGSAKLNVYRKGYGPEKGIGQLDETKPIALGDISTITSENKYNKHSIKISVSGNAATATVDNVPVSLQRTSYPNEAANAKLTLNPLNAVQDVPTFPRLNHIGFSVEKNQQAIFSNIAISEVRAPNSVVFKEDVNTKYAGIFKEAIDGSKVKIENGAFNVNGGNDGVTIYKDPSHTSVPMLRTELKVEKKVKTARLYATARGIYEFYINGERVGQDYFNPGSTEYSKRIMYQSYDVTDLVKIGNNAIGAMLSSGWWSDQMTFNLSNYNYFGDRQSLLGKLVITYEDNSSETIVTDPDTWKYFGEGPITYSGFFNGEDYDATRESFIDGWDQPGYDDRSWTNAVVITPQPAFANPEIVAQIGDNVHKVEEITAKSYSEPRPGVYVYDMGVNMVGLPKVSLKGKKGEKVTFRTAEMLYPDLPEYKNMNGSSMVGMILTENYRAALSTDTYIMNGNKKGETYQPRFTFHGYRYLEITGLDAPLSPEDVKGVVLSSLREQTGSYETSNPSINQLYKNINRSQYGNFLSIPTDTPARDERMGWAGDAQVFARTATYNADVQQFFARFTTTLRDSQAADGGYPIYAPNYTINPQSGGWVAWAAAGIILPYETYQQYGDTNLIQEHYVSMQRFINSIKDGGKINGNQFLTNKTGLADHLSLTATDTPLLVNAIYGYVVSRMAIMAEAIGKTDNAKEYQQLYENIKAEWNKAFVDSATFKTKSFTGVLQDTQASYSLPLAYDMFSAENKPHAAARLADLTKELGYIVTTGFVGTAPLNPALSENGYDEVAYRLLESTKYPSWLYPVVNGSTSMWERWNSYTHENGFGGNNGMNSFNHYALGAVGAWMYNHSLGILRDVNQPGFKHIIFKPAYGGEVTFAKGHYDSVYGRISSGWELKNGTFNYSVTVPANTTANVYLPATDVNKVKEGGQPIAKAKGVKFIEFKDGKAVYELESGSYEFSSTIK
ncbi:glycoside hydrolase family 78 protein [Bacillus sp. X1(2014)]|uniref:glycoside hydrolase family 78 protein n=1 Tax=Bacillus sp. X1(2014) TaxID=1565991 RepID=UPI0011A4F8FF|nr:glycoside hydrolase family 78 protein [Bacillus sp. X1(2014)]